MQTLTLAMIVKNEEKNLPRVLSTITKICSEIIIVDTGSTDRTVDIAESFGATVIKTVWENDFAKARNLSIKDAKSDWILWLDGDDFVPLESIPHIEELVQRKPDCVYAFTVKNERPNGTGTEFLQARMFPNHRGLYFERPVHEQVMLSALRIGLSMVPSTAWVEHHGYADPAEMKQKAERNVTILQANLEIYGDDAVTFVEIGDSYSIMGDQDEADSWYRKTIALPHAERQLPDVVSQAWMGLGNSANVSLQFEEAQRCFNKVIQLCPGRIDLYYNLAVTYEKQDMFQEATDSLMQIFTTPVQKVKVGVDIRQAKIRGGMKLIRILLRWGNEQLLREKIAFLLAEFPDRLEILNVCAAGLYMLEEYTESIRLFNRTMSERPEGNIDALIGLTMIFITAGKDDLALRQIENGQEQFANNCRYLLFRTLFSNDFNGLNQFKCAEIESERSYLRDLFRLEFPMESILAVAIPDEA